MKAAAYLRVSTDDQNESNQERDVAALCEARGWEPVWFRDHAKSGKTTDRPAYQEVMQAAKAGKVRAVVVWKLDRLGRTVLQLVQDFDALKDWGVDLVSVRDPIDTTTPMGRAMFQITAVFAELERNVISDRTRAAYRAKDARAKNLGQRIKWGRPVADVPQGAVAAVVSGKMSQRAAAAHFGVARATLGRAVAAQKRGGADAGGSSPETGLGPESTVSGPPGNREAIKKGSDTVQEKESKSQQQTDYDDAQGVGA